MNLGRWAGIARLTILTLVIGVVVDFELDPAAAVRFASEQQNAPVDVAKSMYLRLAKSNPNAALAALSLVDYTPLAQLAAAAILEALGKDLAHIELVAAALHAGSVDQFRADALISITSIPPREALAAALRLRDADRRTVAAAMMPRLHLSIGVVARPVARGVRSRAAGSNTRLA